MKLSDPSVEGPQFAKRIKAAEKIVRQLEASNWDFKANPKVFSKSASADVLAKEIVHIFDGKRITRIGTLVMGGVGEFFNLMGPIPAHSELRVTTPKIINDINAALGTKGLSEFKEFTQLGHPQTVEFYNYGIFYQLRDLIHWLVLHGAGCFPSTLEHMVRHFATGNVIQNNMYRPSIPSLNPKVPAIMQAACLSVGFSSRAMEWMDKPLFGGLSKETIHVEYLLTPAPSKLSHPYLKLSGESKIELQGQLFYLRRFAGITPKEGTRGPNIPPEGKKFFK
jgi:hypothetical protein